LKKSYKKMLLVLFLLLSATFAFGEDAGGLIKGGESTYNESKGMIASWKWVIPLILFAIAYLPVGKSMKYIESRYQQNQQEMPKAHAKFWLATVYIMSLFGVYIILGLAFFVFGDSDFGNTWNKLVQEPFSDLWGL